MQARLLGELLRRFLLGRGKRDGSGAWQAKICESDGYDQKRYATGHFYTTSLRAEFHLEQRMVTGWLAYGKNGGGERWDSLLGATVYGQRSLSGSRDFCNAAGSLERDIYHGLAELG